MIQTVTVTVPLSGTVSGNIPFVSAAPIGLLVPILTTCSLYIQGNADTTSAGFVRLQKADASGVWAINGAGSTAVNLHELAAPFGYLRLETSVAQAAARTFTVVYKVP